MLTSTLCAALSAAGLGIAVMTAYRKRLLAATRIAAYALVPLGLAVTGIADWISDLVFKPSVWLGFGVLAVSALLFVICRAVERRSDEGGTRKERRAAAAAQRAALAPEASEPSLRGAQAPAQRARRKAKADTSGGGDEFADIEAILKKHGI